LRENLKPNLQKIKLRRGGEINSTFEKDLENYKPTSFNEQEYSKASALNQKYNTTDFTSKYHEIRRNTSNPYLALAKKTSTDKDLILDKKTGKVYVVVGDKIIREDYANFGKESGDAFSDKHLAGQAGLPYVNTPTGTFKFGSFGKYKGKSKDVDINNKLLDFADKNKINAFELKDEKNRDLYFSLHGFPKIDKKDFKKSHGCIRLSDGTMKCLQDNDFSNKGALTIIN